MGRNCKNDFASPLQPSEHTHVSQLFEKRKVGFLHAYGWAAVLGFISWRRMSGVRRRQRAFNEVEDGNSI
jgi:hypothetical protein